MGCVIKVFISLFFFSWMSLFPLPNYIYFPHFFSASSLLLICSAFLFFLPWAWLTDGRNCNLAIWQWLEGYTKHRCCTYCTETRHNLLFNTNYSPRSKKRKRNALNFHHVIIFFLIHSLFHMQQFIILQLMCLSFSFNYITLHSNSN